MEKLAPYLTDYRPKLHAGPSPSSGAAPASSPHGQAHVPGCVACCVRRARAPHQRCGRGGRAFSRYLRWVGPMPPRACLRLSVSCFVRGEHPPTAGSALARGRQLPKLFAHLECFHHGTHLSYFGSKILKFGYCQFHRVTVFLKDSNKKGQENVTAVNNEPKHTATDTRTDADTGYRHTHTHRHKHRHRHRYTPGHQRQQHGSAGLQRARTVCCTHSFLLPLSISSPCLCTRVCACNACVYSISSSSSNSSSSRRECILIVCMYVFTVRTYICTHV